MTSQVINLFNYLLFFAIINVIKSLKIVEFKIPKKAKEGSEVQLVCNYDLEGARLHSFKWYHDEREFYRHEPRARPPYLHFPSEGVYLDKKRSNDTCLTLINVSRLTNGTFACEISSENGFLTKHQESPLIIEAKFTQNGDWFIKLSSFFWFLQLINLLLFAWFFQF